MSLKDFIVINTRILTFLVIYLVLKKAADKEMIKVFFKVFLILCSFSSIIGIIQYSIDPHFFRLGSHRPAFSYLLRSNGVFHAEYIQSFFLISGMILALFVVQSKRVKYFLISLYLTGIVFTFHRMSWITSIIIITIFIFKFKRKEMWKMLPVGVSAGALIFLLLFINSPGLNKFKNSTLFQDRLFSDTMTGRINMYSMILKNIPKSWISGFGDRSSDMYYYGMLSAGTDEGFARGEKGGIHNGFLEVLFFRGIVAFIFYCMFFIFVFDYFWFLGRLKHYIFFIPFFETLKFTLANMTNSFPIGQDLGLLFALFLGIFISVHNNRINEEALFIFNIKRLKILIS